MSDRVHADCPLGAGAEDATLLGPPRFVGSLDGTGEHNALNTLYKNTVYACARNERKRRYNVRRASAEAQLDVKERRNTAVILMPMADKAGRLVRESAARRMLGRSPVCEQVTNE